LKTLKTYYIETNDDNLKLEISNIKISYEDYNQGNPYNMTFDVEIVSGRYSGFSEFEYNYREFIEFIKVLNGLYKLENYTATLNDICYGSQIKFSMDKSGHIEICGEIYERACTQSLVFIFSTDQTAFKKFCKSLYNDFVINTSSPEKAQ
jgi:hypothetical protein